MPTPNPAQVSDVKLERPLTSGETDVLPSWLDRAWRKLQDDLPGLTVRMLTEPPQDPLPPFPVARETVIEVLVAMVERKLRNPDGLRSYGVDDSTTTIDAALSSGQIEPTPAELDRLRPPAQRASGGGGGLFSIRLGRG